MKKLSITVLLLFFTLNAGADFHDFSGVHSIFHHPSNLALSTTPSFDILHYVGVELGNTCISLSDYNHYAVLDTLYEDDKRELLEKFGNPFRLTGYVNSIPFGISIGNFGLAFRGFGGAYGTISKDILDLILNGNELGRIYDVSDTRAEALAFAQASLAYAFKLKDFTLGMSAGYLYGFYHAGCEDHRGKFISDSSYLEAADTIRYRYSQGGQGFSSSFSIGKELGYNTTISVGFENVISNVKWTKDAKYGYSMLHTEKINFFDIIYGDEMDSTVCDTSYEYEKDYQTTLPLIFRVGAKHNFERLPITLFFDYEKGFSNTAISSTTPKISLLAQFRPIGFIPLRWFFPLRFGISTGNPAGVGINLGTGLSFSRIYLDVDYATWSGWFAGSKGHTLSIAMGIRSSVGALIEGVIRDSISRIPLAAKVEVSSKGKIYEDVTDEEGKYAIRFPGGSALISISHPGHEEFSKEIRLKPRERLLEDILLAPVVVEILIAMMDSITQTSLSDVEFYARNIETEDIDTLKTDTEGKIGKTFICGIYEIFIEKGGYKTYRDTINVESALTKTIKLLPQKGILRGKVMDIETEEGLSGDVYIYDNLGNLISETRTDDEGLYEITLEQGTYTAKVNVEGYKSKETTLFVEIGGITTKDFVMFRE